MIWRYVRLAVTFFFALAAGYLLINVPFNFDRMVNQVDNPLIAVLAIIYAVFMIDHFVMALRAVRASSKT